MVLANSATESVDPTSVARAYEGCCPLARGVLELRWTCARRRKDETDDFTELRPAASAASLWTVFRIGLRVCGIGGVEFGLRANSDLHRDPGDALARSNPDIALAMGREPERMPRAG